MTDNERKELLMKAKPILFNTDMVRAILDGRKTVTRRAVKFLGKRNPNWTGYVNDGLNLYNGTNEVCNKKPLYKVGDILYVRETWKQATTDYAGGGYHLVDLYLYKADNDVDTTGMMIEEKWHPSIHMPKEAARIFLRVTSVRVERLQDITEAQAMAEGVFLDSPDFIPTYHYSKDECDIPGKGWNTARECFQWGLWGNTIKKSDLDKYGWNANPWVWVIEFETKGLIENENQN